MYIFNESIRTKTFPTLWKAGKITPLFKSGNSDNEDNYHPITILPTLGKVLERIIHDQLYSNLTDYELLTKRQSGFRKGYSTGTCLIDFLNEIYEEVDQGGACGVLFLDLSKAFDTVDHGIIKIKLKALGVKESSIQWFTSYLTGRIQYTQVDGILSEPLLMNSGVPQGSILGPLLFVCYINDMLKFCGNLLPFIYADDTALLTRNKDITLITDELQNGLNLITSWFKANKLGLNLSKTKSILFTSRRLPFRNFNLDIRSDNTQIESTDTFKYLGITLDRYLTFENHADNIIKKVNQRTRIVWKVRNYVTEELAKYLYLTLVQPLFTYVDYIYDGCSQKIGKKLQVAQNSALRVVKNCKRDYSATLLHNELEIEELSACRRKSAIKMVDRGYKGLGPDILNKLFIPYKPSRSLRSENQNLIQPPKVNTTFATNNLAYRGCYYWNELNTELKDAASLSILKNSLKPYNSLK